MPEGQRESADTLNPIAMMNLDLTIGYENLVLFAQAETAKNSIFAKIQPDLLCVFAEHFCFENGKTKAFFTKVCQIHCSLKIFKGVVAFSRQQKTPMESGLISTLQRCD
jgi:hypothetical protein